MKENKLTQDEALEVRKLFSFPGGLELHIGVRLLCTACWYSLWTCCGS